MRKQQLWLVVMAVALVGALFATNGPRRVEAQGQTGTNWQGYYWNNPRFEGAPNVARVDAAVNFNWGTNAPVAGINGDNFSVRWYNQIQFAAGTYRFRAGADDGIRVAVNGQVVLDRFNSTGSFQEGTADVVLGAGSYQIIVDYYELTGNAGVLFEWTAITGGGTGPITTPGVFPTTAPLFTPTPTRQIKAVVIVDRANVRSGPGLEYPTIAQIARDEVYFPKARNGDFGFETWYLLELGGGARGWAARSVIYVYNGDPASLPKSKEIIDAPALPDAPPLSVPVQPFEVQGVTRNNAMVRSAPSTRTGERIGVIPIGSNLRIIGINRNGAWLLVDYNGLQGWTFTPNIRVTVGSLGVLPRTH